MSRYPPKFRSGFDGAYGRAYGGPSGGAYDNIYDDFYDDYYDDVNDPWNRPNRQADVFKTYPKYLPKLNKSRLLKKDNSRRRDDGPVSKTVFGRLSDALLPVTTVGESASVFGKPAIKDSDYHFGFDMYQFAPEKINVELDGSMLKITGRREVEPDDKGNFELLEFTRHMTIPEEYDAEKVSVEIQKGYLVITAPLKKPQPAGNAIKTIPIQVVRKQ